MTRVVHPLLIVLAALVLMGTTCGRGVSIESEAGPTYGLEVRNPNGFPLTVSYDDGTGPRLLGNAGANGETRSVISRPASTTITVIAPDREGTQRARRQVILRPGSTEVVSLDAHRARRPARAPPRAGTVAGPRLRVVCGRGLTSAKSVLLNPSNSF